MIACSSSTHVTIESPLGLMVIEASPLGLRQLRFASESESCALPRSMPSCEQAHEHAPIRLARRCIEAYFAREPRPWNGLPLDLRLTPFQTLVLAHLNEVPLGQTRTYGDLSKSVLGHPRAARAVASALRANPVLLVLPCHRIVPAGAKQGAGGYSGGPWRKQWLLRWEQSSSRSGGIW